MRDNIKTILWYLLIVFLSSFITDVVMGIRLQSRPTRQEVYDSIYNSLEFRQYIDSIAEAKLKEMCPSLTQDKQDFSMIQSELAYHRFILRKYYPRYKKKLQKFQDYWFKGE